MKKLCLSILCACLSLPLAPLSYAQTHAFIWDSAHGMKDLGTLGGATSYALSINDKGVVVGYSYLSDNATTHAFTWTARQGMVDISGAVRGAHSSQASFVNSSGEIAATIIFRFHQVPAAYLTGGHWLGLFAARSDPRNYSFGINDLNQVTGQQYTPDGVVHGLFWDLRSGINVYLAPATNGLHTVGNAINNLSHVTGTGSVPPGLGFDALFWASPSATPQDLGAFMGSDYSAGSGLNDNDEVTGYNRELEGFYWRQSTGMVALQSLGGGVNPGFGINNSGMIAGYSSTAGETHTHATLWSSYTSAPQDLGALKAGGNSYARGLNNLGQVVGYADAP